MAHFGIASRWLTALSQKAGLYLWNALKAIITVQASWWTDLTLWQAKSEDSGEKEDNEKQKSEAVLKQSSVNVSVFDSELINCSPKANLWRLSKCFCEAVISFMPSDIAWHKEVLPEQAQRHSCLFCYVVLVFQYSCNNPWKSIKFSNCPGHLFNVITWTSVAFEVSSLCWSTSYHFLCRQERESHQ